jgi:hypothetical protein
MTTKSAKSAKKQWVLRGLYVAALVLSLAIPLQRIERIITPHTPAPSPSHQPTPVAPGGAASPGSAIAGAGQASASSFVSAITRMARLAETNKRNSSSSNTAFANTIVPKNVPKKILAQTVVRDRAAQTVKIDGVTYPLRTYKPLLTPNDPLASQPWVASTNTTQAWDTPAGSHDTLLAVIDTGFALKHEEFANRWYINPGESGTATGEAPSALNCTARSLPLTASCNLIDDDANGIVDDETGPATYQNPSRLNCTDQHKSLTKDCNRIDDDGNGLIDDTTGWDFANNDNLPQAGELNPGGAGTTHGTETAGTAAATGNNAKGTAGADWHTKILPIQALDDDSYGDTLGVGRAIQYAASQHANVISISLGSTAPDDYVRYSIATAIAAGSVVVAAAGNTSCDCMLYPANYPEVLSVGALETNNTPAYFTSYGTNLDIMAPGTQVTAPTWSAGNPTAAYAANLAGTSFSAPIVSGTLTRLLSLQPNETALQLMSALTENTNRSALPANTSRTPQLGYGWLDASKATARVTTARTDPFTYGFTPVSEGAFLFPGSPTELPGPVGNFTVKMCPDSQLGTTPLYELTKTGSNANFWSISQAEVWQAQNAGYTSKLFAEVCLQQPQDTTTTIRNLNLFKEFRNIFEAL